MVKRARNPGLLGRIFAPFTTKRTVMKIHLRTAKRAAPKTKRPVGPATAKAKRTPKARPIPRVYTAEYVRRVQAGEIKGPALIRFLTDHAPGAKRRNPASTLAKARAQSRQFHGGAGRGHVVELNAAERRGGRSRFAVLVGEQTAQEYRTPNDSRRGGSTWRHAAGDRGAGKPSSRNAPLLVADPKSGEVFTVRGKSPMRFLPRQGLVG